MQNFLWIKVLFKSMKLFSCYTIILVGLASQTIFWKYPEIALFIQNPIEPSPVASSGP